MTNPTSNIPSNPDWMRTATPKAVDWVDTYRIGLLELQFRGATPARIEIDPGLINDNDRTVQWKRPIEQFLSPEVVQGVMFQEAYPGGPTIYQIVRDAVYAKCQQLGLIPDDAETMERRDEGN